MMQIKTYNCYVTSHFYLYLRGTTTIKEAMENIKKACALGGVSAQPAPAPAPAPTDTKTGPVVPFMQMTDRQKHETVTFRDEQFMDTVENSMEGMWDSIAKWIRKFEKQITEDRSRSRNRNRRYDRRGSYDRSRIEIGLEVEVKLESYVLIATSQIMIYLIVMN